MPAQTDCRIDVRAPKNAHRENKEKRRDQMTRTENPFVKIRLLAELTELAEKLTQKPVATTAEIKRGERETKQSLVLLRDPQFKTLPCRSKR